MDKLTIFFDLDDTLYDRRIPMSGRFYSSSAEHIRKSCRRHLTRSFIAATRSLPLRIPEESPWRRCTSTAIRRGWRRRHFHHAGRGAALSVALCRTAAPHHAERYDVPCAGCVQKSLRCCRRYYEWRRCLADWKAEKPWDGALGGCAAGLHFRCSRRDEARAGNFSHGAEGCGGGRACSWAIRARRISPEPLLAAGRRSG